MGNHAIACPHCGRTWANDRGGRRGQSPFGFIVAAQRSHVSACVERTPEERQATNKRDEARWARKRTRWTITNNPDHEGLKP